jgi:hypothetical protein
MRRVYQPQLDDSFGAVPIDNGGSSSKKLDKAVQYLGLLTNASKGIALGTADLDSNGKIKHALLPESIISEVVNVTGPALLKISQTGIYTITDFDSSTVYDIAATAGVVSRNGETITYTAAATPGNGGFTLNGKSYVIPVSYYGVVTPNITSPTNGQTGLGGTVNFTSNSFAMDGGTDTHASSDWQISTVNDFTSLVSSIADSSGNKNTWSVTGLNPNTTYYVRVRYKAAISGYSGWSPVISFSTSASFTPNAPTFTNPTNGQNSVALSTTFNASAFNSPGVDTHYSSDWQIATDAGFTNIVKSTTDDTVNKSSWLVSGLVDLTTYYARVRYKGANFGYSDWSTVISFTTIQANSINTPSVNSPVNAADGVSLSPTLTSSAFSVTGGSDTHQSSDWQIATDAGFTNIVKSTTGDTVNKTSWSITGLTTGMRYYVRVRYKGIVLPYSAWSTTIYFGTIHVNTPTITSPSTGSTGLMPNITLTSSAFGVTGASDTHLDSTWQIATDSAFTNIVANYNYNTDFKTSVNFNLALNTTYYARVYYRGTTYGASNWSPVITFSTVANYTPNTPNIITPVHSSINQGQNVSFSSSAFAMNGGSATHTSTDWQIATDIGFTTIISSATDDVTNKVNWTSGNLSPATLYYARVRYKASNGIYSAWSAVISFTTKNAFIPDTEEAIINRPFVSGQANANGFSFSVAISSDGSRVVIGAYQADYRTLNLTGTTGCAYVYVRSGSTWTLEQQLPKNLIYVFDSYYGTNYNVTSSSCGDEAFGCSVDITPDGTRIAVGAPFYNHCYSRYGGTESYYYDTGRVIVYIRSGSTWTQEQILINTSSYTPVFGYCVSINNAGDRLLMGGPNYTYSYSNEGRVSYWTRSGSVWTQQNSIGYNSPTKADIKFGLAVAISGDGTRAIVGAPGWDRVYIYTLSATTASLETTHITNSPWQHGAAVDINSDGSIFVAGAPAATSSRGLVTSFKRTGTTWVQITDLIPANLVANDNFGSAVSLSADGTMLAVSALWATRQGLAQCGSVYLFKLNTTTNKWDLLTEYQASDVASGSYYSRSVRLSADKTRLIAGNEIRNKCYIYK